MTPVPQNPPRILFFSTVFPPFIEEDEVILSKHFRLEKLITHGADALRRLPGAILRADVALSWFGSVYAAYAVLLTKIFRKKSIIILAGVDASKDPEIKYGMWLSPWRAVLLRYAFRHADRLLAVDPFLEREAARLASYNGANITSIPFGYDPDVWKEGKHKEEMVLTVASAENIWRFKKKGLDKLFDAAHALPSVRFCLIGIHTSLMEQVNAMKPANLEVIQYVPRGELLHYYQRAKVYCQPSFTEGLPNTLCEAMLCGCVPVGTRVGGIPTAIGEAGYLVEYRDQAGLVVALQQALAAPAHQGHVARERITTEFSRERRERALRFEIDQLCSSSNR